MQILHLDFSPIDSELVRCCLTRNWPDCSIITVNQGDAYVAEVQQRSFDLILSDYTVPDFTGLDALQLARCCQPECPFIFCSGKMEAEGVIGAIRAGATDYVFKDNLDQLIPSIERALQRAAEKRRRNESEAAL